MALRQCLWRQMRKVGEVAAPATSLCLWRQMGQVREVAAPATALCLWWQMGQVREVTAPATMLVRRVAASYRPAFSEMAMTAAAAVSVCGLATLLSVLQQLITQPILQQTNNPANELSNKLLLITNHPPTTN